MHALVETTFNVVLYIALWCAMHAFVETLECTQAFFEDVSHYKQGIWTDGQNLLPYTVVLHIMCTSSRMADLFFVMIYMKFATM